MTKHLPISVAIFLVTIVAAEANLDYYGSQDLNIVPSNYWSNSYMDTNFTNALNVAMGCVSCGEIFYNEPPPVDIRYIPSPPLHPSFHASISDLISNAKHQLEDQCDFCNLISEQGLVPEDSNRNLSTRVVIVLLLFTGLTAMICLYLVGSRRSRIIASLTGTTVFKSSPSANVNHQLDKNSSLNEHLANAGVHLSDPCYLQTNRDKNLTSPIISDHTHHKKTAIPSKYWAQPGSIVNRTVRRVPNEYEIPSSQTNSTGTSSAVYADMNNEGNQRFFSPYNLHTYAEVREVIDPNEHFHTSSNSSAMLSESNYDNTVYNAGVGCIMNNVGVVSGPNGSVQMSDFNSMRPLPMSYNQAPAIANAHHTISHQLPKMHQSTNAHQLQQAIYEQPPTHRAQVILTSNNQGVNPTLLNYRDTVHDVI